jgi:hypothetical protein
VAPCFEISTLITGAENKNLRIIFGHKKDRVKLSYSCNRP